MHEGPGSVAAHLEERVVEIPVFLESKTREFNSRKAPQHTKIKSTVAHVSLLYTQQQLSRVSDIKLGRSGSKAEQGW